VRREARRRHTERASPSAERAVKFGSAPHGLQLGFPRRCHPAAHPCRWISPRDLALRAAPACLQPHHVCSIRITAESRDHGPLYWVNTVLMAVLGILTLSGLQAGPAALSGRTAGRSPLPCCAVRTVFWSSPPRLEFRFLEPDVPAPAVV